MATFPCAHCDRSVTAIVDTVFSDRANIDDNENVTKADKVRVNKQNDGSARAFFILVHFFVVVFKTTGSLSSLRLRKNSRRLNCVALIPGRYLGTLLIGTAFKFRQK